jgi:RNA polymerase sigma-70 factor (ECF subfamily)
VNPLRPTPEEPAEPHEPCEPRAPQPADAGAPAELVERLFREHNEALIRFLRARVRSYHEAREVAQEAYVRLLSLDKPGAVSYLRAFLFRTAANIAIDRRRRSQIHEKLTELPLFQEFADTLTPERRVAGEQTLRQLEQLIATMPPKCQQAFILSQIYGMEFASIATAMGLSESMIRKYVMRALLFCRARMDLGMESGAKDAGHE